jgi:lysophospholipase L1-like esterase
LKASPRRRPTYVVAIGAIIVLVAACGQGGEKDQQAAPAAQPWRVVALGDSETTGQGDPSGKGWVGRYADLVHQKVGRDVAVTNLAREGQTSDELLSALTSDSTVQADVRSADIVLLGIGGADLNAGEDQLAAGTCKAKACFTQVFEDFTRNVDEAVAAAVRLRDGKPTVFRAVTLGNAVPGAEDLVPPYVTKEVGLYEARALRDAICAGMTKHGGRCIDGLTAFNGPDGTADAYKAGLMNRDDCCYPNDKGQQLMAELLYATGLSPLSTS